MKVGVIIGIVTAAFIAALGGYFLVRRMTDPLAPKIAEAQSLGLPVKLQDIYKPSLDPAQNGAVQVQKAIDMLNESLTGDADLQSVSKAVTKSSSDAERKEGEQALQRLKPEMALIVAATQKPHCEFPINWADLDHASFAYAPPLKGFAKAFCLKAELQGSHGDTKGASQNLWIAHRIARLFEDSPLLLHMLVQVACESIVENTLQRMFDKRRRDTAFLTAAVRMHDSFGTLPDIRPIIKTELVYSLLSIDQLKSLKGLISDSDAVGQFSDSDRSAAKAHVLAINISYFRALPRDGHDWNAVHKAAEAAEHADPVEESKHSKPAVALMKFVTQAVWSGACNALERLEARRRLTDTSLRLFLRKAHDGRLPKLLPDFGPSRIDPFSGRPFVYQPSANGFTLYGFGANRVDDGGDPKKDDVLTFD